MPDTSPALRGILSELKRRRVFRVAAVYVVVSWLLVQVANNVFPSLLLPAWTTTLVVVLALTGFPFAIALVWVFDVTPAGVVRTPARPRPRTAGRAREGNSAQPEPIRSIAVLPFTSLSADAENEYFSDGITEELLNALAKIRELRVSARTSSFAFKRFVRLVQRIGLPSGAELARR